jgi:hypothetical protein
MQQEILLDNLTPHLRIRMRVDAEGVIGTTAGYIVAMGEDENRHAGVGDPFGLETAEYRRLRSRS